MLEQDSIAATVLTSVQNAWIVQIMQADSIISLPEVGVEFQLSGIYVGVLFLPRKTDDSAPMPDVAGPAVPDAGLPVQNYAWSTNTGGGLHEHLSQALELADALRPSKLAFSAREFLEKLWTIDAMTIEIRHTNKEDNLARRHRYTVNDMWSMIAAGIIGKHDKVELIGGELVDMPPNGLRHELVKKALNRPCLSG